MQDTTTTTRPIYLTPAHTIDAIARDENPPKPRLDAYGYTVKAGSPTSYRVRIDGQTRWRRVYVWQFSNAGTAFVKIGGVPHIVTDADLDPI